MLKVGHLAFNHHADEGGLALDERFDRLGQFTDRVNSCPVGAGSEPEKSKSPCK